MFLTPSQRRFLTAMLDACPDCGGVTRCVCARQATPNPTPTKPGPKAPEKKPGQV